MTSSVVSSIFVMAIDGESPCTSKMRHFGAPGVFTQGFHSATPGRFPQPCRLGFPVRAKFAAYLHHGPGKRSSARRILPGKEEQVHEPVQSIAPEEERDVKRMKGAKLAAPVAGQGTVSARVDSPPIEPVGVYRGLIGMRGKPARNLIHAGCLPQIAAVLRRSLVQFASPGDNAGEQEESFNSSLFDPMISGTLPG